jgi:hypothetical protein
MTTPEGIESLSSKSGTDPQGILQADTVRSLAVHPSPPTPLRAGRTHIHNQRNFRPKHHRMNPEGPIDAAPCGRGFWHRFLDTLLSSQGADAHRSAPFGVSAGQASYSNQTFRPGQIDVSDLYTGWSAGSPDKIFGSDPKTVSEEFSLEFALGTGHRSVRASRSGNGWNFTERHSTQSNPQEIGPVRYTP